METLGQLHWVHRYFPLVHDFYHGLTFYLCHVGEREDNTSTNEWCGEPSGEEEELLREVCQRERDEEVLSALFLAVQSE